MEGVGTIGGGGAEGEVDGVEEGNGGVADGVGGLELKRELVALRWER